MAIRNIRLDGDEILRKISKPVKELNNRTKELIQDMIDTMIDADGAGIAAPQIGVLKRIFIIDTEDGPLAMINPEILEMSGKQMCEEGCLSIPNKTGIVKRANYVKVKFTNIDGNEEILEGTDFFANVVQHENDHLNGILFTDYIKDKNI